MNEWISSLHDILEEVYPESTTMIEIKYFSFSGRNREIEFWVHSPKGTECFHDPRDLDVYIRSMRKLTVNAVLEEWGMNE